MDKAPHSKSRRIVRVLAVTAMAVTTLMAFDVNAQGPGGGGGGGGFGGGGGGFSGGARGGAPGGAPGGVPGVRLPQRPAGSSCTEVDIDDLPAGAQVQSLMVMVSPKVKPMTPEEDQVVQQCYARTAQAGATPFAASQARESIDLRVPALVVSTMSPQQIPLLNIAYHTVASRAQMTADPKGAVKMFIPRDDLDATMALLSGYTVEDFGLLVTVKNAAGDVVARSNVFLIGSKLTMAKDKVALKVDRGDLKDVVKWTDAAGQPLSWDGRKFTDAAGHAVAL